MKLISSFFLFSILSTIFLLCIYDLNSELFLQQDSAVVMSAGASQRRRLLWSEQLIHDRMAQIDTSVELFAYEPQLIRNVDDESTPLAKLPQPLTWTLDSITHAFWPDCAARTVAQHNAFEVAWRDYVNFHQQMTRGELEPRFVHVGFPPEANIHSRMKVIVSATLLGLALRRAVVVSWVPTPIDSGLEHAALVELFRSPGFDWFYTKPKYDAAHYRRLDVFGFGQEEDETTTYEPLDTMLCADLQQRDEPWLELHWKFDAFAAALYHNPYLNKKLSQWFPADDFYGPIARKLFFPVTKIWRRVESIYAKQYDKSLFRMAQQQALMAENAELLGDDAADDVLAQQNATRSLVVALAREQLRKSRKSDKKNRKLDSKESNQNDRKRRVDQPSYDVYSAQPKSLYVVGLEINRPSELGKLKECVELSNLQPKIKYRRGKKAQAAAAALAAREVRFFVMSPTQKGARDNLVTTYGAEHAFYYHNTDISSDPAKFDTQYPADAREIVEEFLFEFSDAVIVPEKTERNRHMLFSKRALVVTEQRHNDRPICQPDIQCQPCWNWNSVSNATCWQQINTPQRIARPPVCQHSLWYRW